MSRTLKRPMFRRGGTVNDGIMTGLEDRKQLSNGTTLEEYMKEAESVLPTQPKTRLPLGEVGIALASGVPLIDALGLGYKKFTKADDARIARDYQRRLALAQYGLERKGKIEDLEKSIKARKDIARMTLEGKEDKDFTTFKKLYQGSENQAKNRLLYERSGLEAEARKKFGPSFKEFIGGNVHGELKDFEKKQNIGNIYYDVTDGQFKRLRRTTDGEFKFEIISLAGFDSVADKAAIIPKEKFLGEKSKTPGYRRPPKDNIFLNIPEEDPFDPYSGA